jgi:hypothetical protein
MYKIPESMKGKVGSYDLSKFNKPSNPNKNQETIDNYLQGGKQENRNNYVSKNVSKGNNNHKQVVNTKSDISSRLSRLLATKGKTTSVPAARTEPTTATYSRKPNLSIFKGKPAPYELEDEVDEEDVEDTKENEGCEYLTTQSSLEDIINALNYLMSCMKEDM